MIVTKLSVDSGRGCTEIRFASKAAKALHLGGPSQRQGASDEREFAKKEEGQAERFPEQPQEGKNAKQLDCKL